MTIDSATVGGVRLQFSRNSIQRINLARPDNGHIVVGLADANKINQSQIVRSTSQLEQGDNRVRLRLRFAAFGYFGRVGLPVPSSPPAFYVIVGDLIPLEVCSGQRDGVAAGRLVERLQDVPARFQDGRHGSEPPASLDVYMVSGRRPIRRRKHASVRAAQPDRMSSTQAQDQAVGFRSDFLFHS